jgi:segregation and condensation protein B
LETLATVAYHQPITLAEISALRGVDTTHSLKNLLQRKLVKITGRKKGPGRPLIYRTTERFLAYFGLDSLKDLPSEEEITKILDEEKILDG